MSVFEERAEALGIKMLDLCEQEQASIPMSITAAITVAGSLIEMSMADAPTPAPAAVSKLAADIRQFSRELVAAGRWAEEYAAAGLPLPSSPVKES